MSAPGLLVVLSRLGRATFRQALASRLLWVALGGSLLLIVLCAGLGIEGGGPLRHPGDTELYGPDGQPLAEPGVDNGALTIGFGAVRVPLFRDAPSMIVFLQIVLAKWLAGGAGTLLALVATAGFLPELLRPQSATVLLTKPVSRTVVLVGTTVGILAFTGALACLFIGGTWLAIGVRTGIWPEGYLLSIPLLLLNFATLFGVSALLAVWTRSTTVSILGPVVLWLLCLAVNYGRHSVVAASELAPERTIVAESGPASRFIELGYWMLPKPADLAAILDAALDADEHLATSPTFDAVRRQGRFHPPWIVVSGLMFSVAAIGLASRDFERVDF